MVYENFWLNNKNYRNWNDEGARLTIFRFILFFHFRLNGYLLGRSCDRHRWRYGLFISLKFFLEYPIIINNNKMSNETLSINFIPHYGWMGWEKFPEQPAIIESSSGIISSNLLQIIHSYLWFQLVNSRQPSFELFYVHAESRVRQHFEKYKQSMARFSFKLVNWQC